MATLVVLSPSSSVSGQSSSQTPDQPLRGSISRTPSLQPRTQNPLTVPPPQSSNIQPTVIPTLSISTPPYRASQPSAGSVSNATTQPNSHGPPSPSINPNHATSTVLLDPYRDPRPLPRYTKKPAIYVYPYAPVGQSHHDRAPAIINIFRENVYKSKVKISKSKRLREQGHLIDYEVKMCGPSAQESQPSILVICTKEVLPALKSLLIEDHIRFQYSRDALSPIKKMVANVLKQPGHTAEDSHMPRFNLYFWPDPRKPRTNLWCSTTVRTSLNPSPFSYTSQAVALSDLTMCGSLVHPISNDSNSSSKFSTLGCLIQVKSNLHGLTAAHTFIAQPKGVSDDYMPEAIGTCFEGRPTEIETAESMDDGPIIDYDEDYDLSSDSEIDTLAADGRGYPLVASHDRGGGSEPLLPQELTGKTKATTVESVVVIPGKEDCTPDESDRDWALVEIQHPHYKLPNAYIVNQSSPQLAFFSTIASQHPREAREVHMISASPLTKNGILLPGSSYLGGLSGRGPCEVWNVTMSGSDALSEGDSGSLVVDAVTHVVYGHVVASNPLGEIYVVPLSAVVKQIQAVFQTKDVQLPEPLPLLTNLAVSCVESKQYAQGRAAFTALCELVQSMCCAEEWPLLFSWATSPARNALLDLPDHQLAKLFVSSPRCVGSLIRLQSPRSQYHFLIDNQPESRHLEDMRKPLTLRHLLCKRLHYVKLSGIVDFPNLQEPIQGALPFSTPEIIAQMKHEDPIISQLFADRQSCTVVNRCIPFILFTDPKTHISTTPEMTQRDLVKFSITNQALKHFQTNLRLTQILCRFLRSRGTQRITTQLVSRNMFTRVYTRSESSDHTPRRESVALNYYSLFKYSSFTSVRSTAVRSVAFLESGRRLADGGFGKVYQVTIPSAPSCSWASPSQTVDVACKELSKRTTHISRWQNESEALRRLQILKSPHIITLLASYSSEENYYLIFPLAKCDLDFYMTSDPPSSDESFCIWMFKQLSGLASGLELLHTGLDDGNMEGAHMDIKPANILLFDAQETLSYGALETHGTLVLADFGLATFRSKKPLNKYRTSSSKHFTYACSRADRQYAAPEAEVPNRAYSRMTSYDIWSFGCLLIEICVWLACGADGRRQFHLDLQSDSPDHPPSYYAFDITPTSSKISLKPQVSNWLRRLRELTKINATLQATLEFLVYGQVLDPNPHTRTTAAELRNNLRAILNPGKRETIKNMYSLTYHIPVWDRMWILHHSSDPRGDTARDNSIAHSGSSLPRLPNSATEGPQSTFSCTNFSSPDSNLINTPAKPNQPAESSQTDVSATQREMVFCHACKKEWRLSEHSMSCPACLSGFPGIIESSNGLLQFNSMEDRPQLHAKENRHQVHPGYDIASETATPSRSRGPRLKSDLLVCSKCKKEWCRDGRGAVCPGSNQGFPKTVNHQMSKLLDRDVEEKVYMELTQEKQKCPYCSTVGRPISLKYHIKSLHRKERPYVCPECNRLFLRNRELVEHKRGTCSKTHEILSFSENIYTDVNVSGTEQALASSSQLEDSNAAVAVPTVADNEIPPQSSGTTSSHPPNFPTRPFTDNLTNSPSPAQMRSGSARRYTQDADSLTFGGPRVKSHG